MCIIGINLGKNKSRSVSHDKVTMYKLSYVNSHIFFKNIYKFQLIIAQITIGSLPPPRTNIQYICFVSSFVVQVKLCKFTYYFQKYLQVLINKCAPP